MGSRSEFQILLLVKYKFIVLFWLIMFISCGGNTSNIMISGVVTDAPNHLILLREASDNQIQTIDSTRTDSLGLFSFSVLVDEPKFYMLQLEGETEPIILLVKPDDKIELKAQKYSFGRDYSVVGSKESVLVRDLNIRLNEAAKRIDSMASYYRKSIDHPKFDSIKLALDSNYDKLIEEHRNFTINFIKENRYSLVSIIALYQQFDKKTYVLNKREDFHLFQLVDSVLYPLYPNNQLVNNLHVNVKKIKDQFSLYDRRQDMLSVGKVTPRLLFPLIDGDSLDVSKLNARYILLYFWASWCNDCLPYNQKLKQVYNQYKSKGFEVVQISLDDDPTSLERAVERDSLTWWQAVDFKQWDSPIVDSFHINSIPANYLVDKKGVIISRNLHPETLSDTLSKLLP